MKSVSRWMIKYFTKKLRKVLKVRTNIFSFLISEEKTVNIVYRLIHNFQTKQYTVYDMCYSVQCHFSVLLLLVHFTANPYIHTHTLNAVLLLLYSFT